MDSRVTSVLSSATKMCSHSNKTTLAAVVDRLPPTTLARVLVVRSSPDLQPAPRGLWLTNLGTQSHARTSSPAPSPLSTGFSPFLLSRPALPLHCTTTLPKWQWPGDPTLGKTPLRRDGTFGCSVCNMHHGRNHSLVRRERGLTGERRLIR